MRPTHHRHQLRTNPGLFDGLYGFCGQAWSADGTFYVYNVTKNGQCSGTVNETTTPIPGGADMLAEAKRQNMDFQPVVHLMDPAAAIKSMAESGANSKYITTFAAAAKKNGWKGLNLDWEGSNTTSTALSGSISTVLTGLSWIYVGVYSRRALPSPVCA